MSSFLDYDSIYRKNVPDSAEEDKVKNIVGTTKASIIKILQEKSGAKIIKGRTKIWEDLLTIC